MNNKFPVAQSTQDQPRNQKLSNYKPIDEEFLSDPKHMYILERLIRHITEKNLSQQDLHCPNIIQNLLKFSFSLDKQPEDEIVRSVRLLFQNTSVGDFKLQLYRHSPCVAIFLWDNRVQQIVRDPEKVFNRFQVMHRLYCCLSGLQHVPKLNKDLKKDQGFLVFKDSLKYKSEMFGFMKDFTGSLYKEDLNEVQKNDVTYHARRFM